MDFLKSLLGPARDFAFPELLEPAKTEKKPDGNPTGNAHEKCQCPCCLDICKHAECRGRREKEKHEEAEKKRKEYLAKVVHCIIRLQKIFR